MGLLTLNSLDVGQRGIVNSIAGGRTASRRLCEMGFNRGSRVQVIKSDFGPIIVSLSGSKIALGRGLASKILVQPEEV